MFFPLSLPFPTAPSHAHASCSIATHQNVLAAVLSVVACHCFASHVYQAFTGTAVDAETSLSFVQELTTGSPRVVGVHMPYEQAGRGGRRRHSRSDAAAVPSSSGPSSLVMSASGVPVGVNVPSPALQRNRGSSAQSHSWQSGEGEAFMHAAAAGGSTGQPPGDGSSSSSGGGSGGGTGNDTSTTMSSTTLLSVSGSTVGGSGRPASALPLLRGGSGSGSGSGSMGGRVPLARAVSDGGVGGRDSQDDAAGCGAAMSSSMPRRQRAVLEPLDLRQVAAAGRERLDGSFDSVNSLSTRSTSSDTSVPESLDLVKVNDFVLPLRHALPRSRP